VRGLRPFFTAALIVGLTAAARADVTFEATVNKNTVSMNDNVMLQLIITGSQVNLPNPELPPIPGFQAYSSGQSQNFSVVNGQMSARVVYSFALTPQAPGDYQIPSFGLNIDGKQLNTAPIPVKVVSGGAPSAAAPGGPEREDIPANKRDLFVTTRVDKTTAHVGEMITLNFRFYSRIRLTAQPAYTPAETTGFLAEDLPPQRQFMQNVHGQNYSVVELRTALFPSGPGKFTIGPASLQCRVQDFSPSGGDPFQGFLEDFFGGGKVVTLRSDPITIQVRPLPSDGRPDGFKGDVGRYSVDAALDKTAVQVHEPVTLTVTVSGEGNVKSLSQPALPALQGVKVYETVNSLNVSKDNYTVRGSKVFKTILKPDVSGALQIPPLALSYFNPKTDRYETARSSSLTLNVKPGPPGPVSDGGATAEGVRVIGQDIRFIKTAARLKPRRRAFTDSGAFWFVNGLPPFFFFGLWGWRNQRRHRTANSAEFSFRGAARRAQKTLQRADALLKTGKCAESHEQIQKALLDYLGDKLRVPAHGLTWDTVAAGAQGRLKDPAVLSRLQNLWNELDRVRFAPSSSSDDEARGHLAEARALLRDAEKQWRS